MADPTSPSSTTDSTTGDKIVSSVSMALRAVWWLPLLRGLALVLLGVFLMIEPLAVLATLVWVFGVFLLVDAVLVAAQAIANRQQEGWKWWLIQGLVDIVFAGFILLWPGITTVVLLYILLMWTIALGITAIIAAAALARNKDLGWPWALSFGLLTTLFGATLLIRGFGNVATLSVLAIVFGVYAFIAGSVQIVSAFSVRAVARDIDEALTGQSAVLQAIQERQAHSRAQAATSSDSAEDSTTPGIHGASDAPPATPSITDSPNRNTQR
ncbi:HdeD family acid-resistance protein [Jonesia quinghaiensis]|uniref:HdeD family acid-resistance protein n=1 Tax=Jonesia quinghaiensis TaxID=262806 RepID=UPI0004246A64|nr:DUF308 domain-containing protein [Jonesia quinghaiensis]